MNNHAYNTEQSPVVLALCPGIGGLERGIERALGIPLSVACYVEIESFIVENILSSIEAGLVAPALIWTNLKTFPYHLFTGKIHGITSGYPCQPFSLAGKRQGEDDPRHLWPFIRTGIETIKPVWFFAENVDDHITMGFDTVYKDLRELGYLVETGIYSAEEVGAPHERQRLYIFAIRQEMAYTNGYDPGRIVNNVLRTQRESATKKDQRERHRDELSPCGEVMANARSIGIREVGSIQQSEQFEPDGLPGGDEELGDTQSLGCERQPNGGGGDTTPPAGEGKQWGRPIGTDTTFRGWPAGQGPFQYEWEEPRTIESRMEYTVNGYNFVGDLHRAIGNSVVEQTAERAFIELIHKHIKSANYGR